MTTAKILKSMLIATLLSSAAALADGTVRVAVEDGKRHGEFKVGDARCVVVESQIRCSLSGK